MGLLKRLFGGSDPRDVKNSRNRMIEQLRRLEDEKKLREAHAKRLEITSRIMAEPPARIDQRDFRVNAEVLGLRELRKKR